MLRAQEDYCILGCIKGSVASRSRDVILPLCSTLMRPHLSIVFSSGAPSVRYTWNCWFKSREGPLRWSEDWSTFPIRTGWESWNEGRWGQWSTGTDCPEQLWILHPRNFSRPGWMGLWAIWSSRRCLCP